MSCWLAEDSDEDIVPEEEKDLDEHSKIGQGDKGSIDSGSDEDHSTSQFIRRKSDQFDGEQTQKHGIIDIGEPNVSCWLAEGSDEHFPQEEGTWLQTILIHSYIHCLLIWQKASEEIWMWDAIDSSYLCMMLGDILGYVQENRLRARMPNLNQPLCLQPIMQCKRNCSKAR